MKTKKPLTGLVLTMREQEPVEIFHNGEKLLLAFKWTSNTRQIEVVYSGPQSFKIIRENAKLKTREET